MTMERLPSISRERLALVLESILFVAEEPVELSALVKSLRRSAADVEKALDQLDNRYQEAGIRLQRSQNHIQLVSAPESGPYVERFLAIETRQRLSGAALEALAVIAYRQPITRAIVEEVRGVNSDAAIASLSARGLVEEVDRAPGPGRPALFATTLKFLEHFGLKSPEELPPLSTNGESADESKLPARPTDGESAAEPE